MLGSRTLMLAAAATALFASPSEVLLRAGPSPQDRKRLEKVRSIHRPHQGERERQRRLRRLEKAS